jgi:hypothetical protein
MVQLYLYCEQRLHGDSYISGLCQSTGAIILSHVVEAVRMGRGEVTGSAHGCRYSAPVGAAIGLFLGQQLGALIDLCALRFSVPKVDGAAVTMLVCAAVYILRPR